MSERCTRRYDLDVEERCPHPLTPSVRPIPVRSIPATTTCSARRQGTARETGSRHAGPVMDEVTLGECPRSGLLVLLEKVPGGVARPILDFEADVDRILSLYAGPTKSVPKGPAPKGPRRGGQLDENGV